MSLPFTDFSKRDHSLHAIDNNLDCPSTSTRTLQSHSQAEKSLFISDGSGDFDKDSVIDVDDYGPPDEYGLCYPMEWQHPSCGSLFDFYKMIDTLFSASSCSRH